MAALLTSRAQYLYFKGWRQVTSEHFLETEWPKPQAVEPLVSAHHGFMLLYNELCTRHIFMHGQPGLLHRFESWTGYRALFDLFLEGKVGLRVPADWRNDLIDEFLFQWGFFHAFRHQCGEDKDAVEVLVNSPNVWKTATVLSYLQSFYATLPEFKTVALVGMCRVHCMLCDYRQALRVLDPVDLDDQRSDMFQLPSCTLSLLYHLGFAYFMSRRYSDALGVLSRALVGTRVTKDSAASFAEDQIVSKYDKMLSLAALCVVLCPGLHADEQVRRMIADKLDKAFGRDASKMDHFAAGELFAGAAPRFVNPAMPNYAAGVNGQAELTATQRRWFLAEVTNQLALPNVLAILKLYASIPVGKLSRFCNVDAEALKQALISLKCRNSQLVRAGDGSPPISGARAFICDVNFSVHHGDMVVVSCEDPPAKFAKFFANNALEFIGISEDLASKF